MMVTVLTIADARVATTAFFRDPGVCAYQESSATTAFFRDPGVCVYQESSIMYVFMFFDLPTQACVCCKRLLLGRVRNPNMGTRGEHMAPNMGTRGEHMAPNMGTRGEHTVPNMGSTG